MSSRRTSFSILKRCSRLAFLLPLSAGLIQAYQTFTTLQSFDGTDGAPTYSALVQASSGDLYGTTVDGGANDNHGTIFKITPSGTLTTVYSFCSQSMCADGAHPYAGVVQATNGDLYGTTTYGGAYSEGTIFKMTPSGTLTTLHSFCSQSACADGAFPYAGLAQAANGDLYGTTSGHGAFGGGTIFKITSSGTLTTLYSFCALGGACIDGDSPKTGLVQARNGEFYGTTGFGGAYGGGTIFKITASGALTTLYSFCSRAGCSDGDYPNAGLVQGIDGDLYGTTTYGTNNRGTIFKIIPGGTFTSMYSFCSQTGCSDGTTPGAGLTQGIDGELYGTTGEGGAKQRGTVFKMTPTGTLTTVYSFCALKSCADGIYPYAGLVQDTNGDFYGTTQGGGANGCCYGTVFRLSVGLDAFLETRPVIGTAGEAVTILGSNLTSATSVTFIGVAAEFTVVSASEISTTVPAGATTGKVQVMTPSGKLSSNMAFEVVP